MRGRTIVILVVFCWLLAGFAGASNVDVYTGDCDKTQPCSSGIKYYHLKAGWGTYMGEMLLGPLAFTLKGQE